MWHLENGSRSIHVSMCKFHPLATYVKSIDTETAHEYKAEQMTPNVHSFIMKHENGSKTCIAALVESISDVDDDMSNSVGY